MKSLLVPFGGDGLPGIEHAIARVLVVVHRRAALRLSQPFDRAESFPSLLVSSPATYLLSRMPLSLNLKTYITLFCKLSNGLVRNPLPFELIAELARCVSSFSRP